MFTWWSGEKLETLVKNGLVEDLTDLWDSDFVSAGVPEGIKDAFTVDGKVYAAPYSILYNPVSTTSTALRKRAWRFQPLSMNSWMCARS